MRSVQVSRFGPPEVMEFVDGPPPDPAAGELLVDVVFDGAGCRLGAAASTVLRWGGRFFSYGAAAGGFADVEQAAKDRDVEVIRIHDDFTADAMRRGADTAMQQLADALVEPVIGQQRPLAEAAAAHAAIQERRVAGKSVLLP